MRCIFIIGTLVFAFSFCKMKNIMKKQLWGNTLFEQLGGIYRQAGDYRLPNISLPDGIVYISG